MARRLTDAQAKAKRQKKIAIGGTVMLLLLLAVQLPKTLKMLHPKPRTTAATAVSVSTGTTPSGAPSVTVAANGTSVTASAGLPESEQPPTAGDGQLVSFERFASKDPFTQQVGIPTTAAPATASGTVTVPADGAAAGGSGTSGGSTGFTTGTDTGATTTAAPPATATTLSINGEAEAVATAADFPAADPIFTLVKLGKDGKSVQIGIAGGTLSTGHDTVALELGKPVTLMNTADGTRYTIVLLTVQGF